MEINPGVVKIGQAYDYESQGGLKPKPYQL